MKNIEVVMSMKDFVGPTQVGAASAYWTVFQARPLNIGQFFRPGRTSLMRKDQRRSRSTDHAIKKKVCLILVKLSD